jgi:FRG domain
MPRRSPQPHEKIEAMKIIDDLIAGNKGRDIFRGQPRIGLKLLPKALRKEFKTGYHLEALKSFRRECWAFGLEAANGLEDLAVAQHYGLATNLLDWTTNPLVALFFASEEDHKKNGEVFVLNNPLQIPDEYLEDDKWQEVEGLRLYNPRLVDARIARQKGLFTIQDKAVGEIVRTPELISHSIPAELKQALLEILYMMGIDRSTLFPDADGLCTRINWETKNRIDRDFPPLSGSRVVYLETRVFAKSLAVITPRLIKAAPSD